MMNYAFYFTASQSVGEGQGNTHTEVMIDRQTNIMGQIGRPTGIESTYIIGLVFSWIIIQSDL